MSDPIELLERRLERILSNQSDSAGIHFFCQVGGRYDELGITTLQISGSGWALVSWRADEDTDMYSYQLDEDALHRFYAMLLEEPFWRSNVKRRSRDEDLDEVNVHLRLSDQTKGTCNGLQFWTGDLVEHERLSHTLDRLARIIDVLTEGNLALFPEE